VLAYGAVLPVLFASRYDLFVRYLVRAFDHLSKLLAHLGIRMIRERPF
jgi:hypothetical protein